MCVSVCFFGTYVRVHVCIRICVYLMDCTYAHDYMCVCVVVLQAVRMATIGAREAALLEARSAPVRKYLLDTIVPSLTHGLLEVARVKPDDPVDFLVRAYD